MKKQKNQGKIKIINLCVEQIFLNTIGQNSNYNIYSYNYSTISTIIPRNIELGETLRKTKYPNDVFNEFLSKQDARAVYTDGSKSSNSRFVGTATVCPALDINIIISLYS